MKTTTATFDTENALNNRLPVFILEFSGLTRKYCSGTFGDITGDYKKYISSVRLSATGIEIPKNNIKLGRAEIVVTNKDLDVTDLVTQNNLNKLTVTIKFGFQGLNDADFFSFTNWVITGIAFRDTGTEVVFTFQDASRLAAKDIFDFEQKTNMAGDATSTHTTIDCDSTTGFIDTTNIPSEILLYMGVGVRIKDTQNVGYTEIPGSGTEFGSIGNPNIESVAITGTVNTDFLDNDEIKQIIFFRDIETSNPDGWGIAKMVLHVLLTGGGHAYYDLETYDSNFKGFGVGLTATEVDIDAIENFEGLVMVNSVPYGEDDLGGRIFVTDGKSRNALEFLAEYLNMFGAYMYIASNGKWTIGTYDSSELIIKFAEVVDFDEGDTVDFQYSIDWNKLINQIDLKFDLQKMSGESINKEVTVKLNESVTDYNANENNFIIENDLSKTSVTNAFLQYNYARRWLYTFGNPPGRFSFNSRTKNIIYDPGDHVLFSLAEEVDTTGASSSRAWSDKKAILTGQDITFSGSIFDIRYKGMVFDVLDEVSGFHTDTTFASGDMDDSTLDPTGTNGTALEAADAYIDVGTSTQWDAFRFTIQWTNPDNGTDLYNLFAVAIHAQQTTPTDLFTVVAQPSMVYFTGDANVITRSFFCVDQSLAGTNVERIKIDVFDLRESDGTAVAAGDRPASMTVTEIIASTLNKTISVV